MISERKLVIIPTYQEAENIQALLHAIMNLSVPYDVLIVDDGSPDGTADLVRKVQSEYPGRIHLIERSAKQGLGTAYIAGFKFALRHRYDYIFEMDADFSHNPADLIRLFEACKDGGADLAIGSRYVRGVNVINWPMSRVVLSYFASRYVRFITGLPVHDATAGFKCYARRVLESINLDRVRFIGYAFQIEMKYIAWKKGFTIREIPVIFTDRSTGTSKMSKGIIKEAIFGVIKLKLRSIFKPF
ncbi:MAG: polyprenol monophosphomannose synthase [Thermaurantimonas sp.]